MDASSGGGNLVAFLAELAGYSGADIRALANEAGLQALIRIADSPAGGKEITRALTLADFLGALENLG